MTELVERVSCSVIITLNDGTEIDVSLSTVGSLSNITNYITSINLVESTNTANQNPVGVVSSNTLKLVLKSNDRSLIPDNEDSVYYGRMDNTAIINVTLEDEDGEIEFNTFYISSWVSNTTSSNPNQVTIEATDLLSIINKNSVPSSELLKNVSTNEIFISTINKLNASLEEKYRIQYDVNDIDFSAYPTLEITNFEADRMGTWFNILSQSTLTNVYYTRDNKLVTDYCLDDAAGESVCTLSDKVNITNASVDKGGLVGYTGVKVNYILNTINNLTELTTLREQVLNPGDNTFDNIDLGNKIYKLGYISVNTDSKTVIEVVSLTYGKNTATIVLRNNTESVISCNISIFGQTLKENKLFVTRTKSNSSNEILEVTNSIVPVGYINKFANELLSLIGIKASALKISGFFNPRIKLGDIVYVDVESSINTKGYYKVTELNWKISNTIKCEAKVIKTIAQGGV